MERIAIGLALSIALGLSGAVRADGPEVALEVQVPRNSVSVPLTLPAPADAPELGQAAGPLGSLPVQRITVGPWAAEGPVVAMLVPPEMTGEPGEFSLQGSNAGEAPAFRFEESEGLHLDLLYGDRPVLSYNNGKLLKPGVPEQYRRSSYVHPIYGLDGEVITDDFPPDHWHHRGLYWAWPYVDIAGKRYDLWVCAGIEPRFDAWLGREAGPVCAVFGVDNGWYVGDRQVVDEVLWYRVWDADETGRAIDVDIKWIAQDQPVTLTGREDKGYGGVCLRFAPRKDTVITTDTGLLAEDSLETPFEWADLSARLEGAPGVSGAALLVHPANPGFPNGWMLRHYGLLACSWPGTGSVTLEPGQPVHVRYRVYVHRGDAGAGKVADAWRAYRETEVR